MVLTGPLGRTAEVADEVIQYKDTFTREKLHCRRRKIVNVRKFRNLSSQNLSYYSIGFPAIILLFIVIFRNIS